MKHFGKLALAVAGAAVLTASNAQAAIVCNKDGDCWRVKNAYRYKPEFGLRVYGDNWKWKGADKGKYRWREAHSGRGYWRNGVWITF
jgi:hypothetical protein